MWSSFSPRWRSGISIVTIMCTERLGFVGSFTAGSEAVGVFSAGEETPTLGVSFPEVWLEESIGPSTQSLAASAIVVAIRLIFAAILAALVVKKAKF
jgi:hypothetical protein